MKMINDSRNASMETLIHIEWNLKGSIDMQHLSKELGFTEKQLNEAFYEQTSFSIQEYMEKRRFTEIMKRLAQTCDEVAVIAEDFSFPNTNTLVSFLQEFNVNPFCIRKGYLLDGFNLTESIVDSVINRLEIAGSYQTAIKSLNSSIFVS